MRATFCFILKALPMTDYEVLTEDYTVQRTAFGNQYEVVANFGSLPFLYHGQPISSKECYFGEIL